jgi:Domain of unknown function (DUF4398)
MEDGAMRRSFGVSLLSAALLAAAGCATKPPTEKVEVAEAAVQSADTRGAAEDAPLELRLAREKLERARTAMAKEEYVTARRLAEQAQVDAQLAEAKAQSSAALNSAREMRDSIESLRDEADRASRSSSGSTAPAPSIPEEIAP